MPTRYLKPGVCDSERINALSDAAECLFYRLLVNVDDFGRMDARPALVKSRCYPVKESVTPRTCEKLLAELAAAQLLVLYEVEAKPYLQMQKWDSVPRAKVSKCPAPADGCIQMHASAQQPRTDAKRLHTNLPVTGTETGTDVCAEPQAAAAQNPVGAPPPVASLPLVDGSEHPIAESTVAEWSAAYPGVNVLQELRQMRAWLNANPTKRKTKRGVEKFAVGWLGREQDRGGKGGRPPAEGDGDWLRRVA